MSEQTQALEIVHDKPEDLMRKATDVASVCRDIVVKTAIQIQGKKYVKCEGWMSIATAHGCVAGSREVRRVEEGWTAIGEIRRISDGALLAQAEGFVGKDEKRWREASEYACRAMAQTRAISRACRAAFAHVVVLMDSNLSTTPAEEVPEDGFSQKPLKTIKSPHPNAQNASESLQDAKKRASGEKPQATDAHRRRFLELCGQTCEPALVLEYFVKAGLLLPTEGENDLHLSQVPATKEQADQYIAAIKAFANGDEAKKPAWLCPAPIEVPRDNPKAPEEGDPPCFQVIVPIPHKGQKRDDYLKDPDTIGSLYHAQKGGDEAAGKRLWGFANHFEPKGWVKRSGEQMPPSASDLKFREALDEFLEWHEKNHSDNDLTP